MDTALTVIPTAPETSPGAGEGALFRKEIRRQKLTEYLTAKANHKLSSNRTNVGKGEKINMEKVSMDKENRTPHKPSNKDAKVRTLTLQSTHVVIKPLGHNIKANQTVRNATGTQSRKNASMINTEVKTKHTLTSTYTISSSKPPNTHTVSRKPSSGTGSSNTHAAKMGGASASLKNSVNGRMIHGPIIKTRTGLVPAITRPRNDIVGQAPSSHILYKTVSRASNVSLRKNTSTVTLQPVKERTVAMAQKESSKPNGKYIRPSVSNKSSTLPLTTRPASKSAKSDTKVGTAKANGAASHSRNVVNTNKPGQGKTNPTSIPPRYSFRVNTKPNASHLMDKSKNTKNTETKKAVSKSIESRQKEIRAVSKTAPQPPRTFSITNKCTDIQTPQVREPPHTANKTLTAAQEERIRKLKEWRDSKGISYKRPSLLPKPRARRTVAVPQPFWAGMKDEDEAHSLIRAVDRSLADCIKLLGEGCPTHQVKEVLSRLPAVSQKFAKYWICQARVMERDGNLDVLPMFEKAVGIVLEPVDELRTVVFEVLKKRDEIQENKEEEVATSPVHPSPEGLTNSMMTPKPVRALIRGERGDSSVVKYKITATPGGPPTQQTEPTLVNGQEVLFFTPVRRSVRIERASVRYPRSLHDHDLCVESYNDLMAEEEERETPASTNSPMYVYRENQALREKVQVQYVCSDE